ncbi:hypothetical protein AADZ91_04120 [Colwelliaceae bacterium 6441]
MKTFQLIIIVLISLLLLGCGGGGSSSPSKDPIDVNHAPVATAGEDFTIYFNGSDDSKDIQFSGTASDSDGDELTYLWKKISGPEGELANEDTLTPYFKTAEVDSIVEVTFSFTVTDPDGLSHSDEIVVTLIPAVAVSINFQNFNTTEVQLFELHQLDQPLTEGVHQLEQQSYYFNIETLHIDLEKFYLIKALDNTTIEKQLHLVVKGDQLSSKLQLNAMTDAFYQSIKYSLSTDDISKYFSSIIKAVNSVISYDNMIQAPLLELPQALQVFASEYEQLLIAAETESRLFNALILFFDVELAPKNTENLRKTEPIKPALLRLPFGLNVEWQLNGVESSDDNLLLDVGTNSLSATVFFESTKLITYKSDYQVIDEITVAQQEVIVGQATTIDTINSQGEFSSIYVPENALSTDTTITVSEQQVNFSAHLSGEIASKILKLEPSGLSFQHPVSIQIPYFGNPTPEDLTVVRISEGDIVDRIAPDFIDVDNKIVHFKTEHFTKFVLDKNYFSQSSSEKVLNTLNDLSENVCDEQLLPSDDCDILDDLSNSDWEALLNIKEESDDTLYDLYSAWYAGRNIYHHLLANQAGNDVKKYNAVGESFLALFNDQAIIDSMGEKYLKILESGISEYDDITEMTAKAGVAFTFLKRKNKLDMLKLVGLFIGNPLPMDFASWYTTEVLGAANKALKELDNQLIGQQISRYYSLRTEEGEQFNSELFLASVKSSFKNQFEIDGYKVQYRYGFINDGSIGTYKKFPVDTYEGVLAFWRKVEIYYQRLIQYKAYATNANSFTPSPLIFGDLNENDSLIADNTLIEIFLDAYDWQHGSNEPYMTLSAIEIAGQPASLSTPHITIQRKQNELASVKNELITVDFNDLVYIDASKVNVHLESSVNYMRTNLTCTENNQTLTCESSLPQSLDWGINNLSLHVSVGSKFSITKPIRFDIKRSDINTPPKVTLVSQRNRTEYQESETIAYEVLATDDGSIDNISWRVIPSNGADVDISPDINGNKLSFTAPYVNNRTKLIISVTVKDDQGETTTRMKGITIEPSNTEFTGKFSTNWLDGKVFWRLNYHFDNNQMEESKMQFDKTHITFEEDSKTVKYSYEITSDGLIKYRNDMNYDMYIGTSYFNKDYIKLCWGGTAHENCWSDDYQNQFEYLFYDRQKADSFGEQAENTRGVYEVWGGNSLPSTGIDWFNPQRNGYKLLGKGKAGVTQKFYGNYKQFVIISRFGSSLYLDSILGSNGQYYGQSSTTSNVVEWENIQHAPDGKTATFKFVDSFYGFQSLDENISYIKIYTTRFKY